MPRRRQRSSVRMPRRRQRSSVSMPRRRQRSGVSINDTLPRRAGIEECEEPMRVRVRVRMRMRVRACMCGRMDVDVLEHYIPRSSAFPTFVQQHRPKILGFVPGSSWHGRQLMSHLDRGRCLWLV